MRMGVPHTAVAGGHSPVEVLLPAMGMIMVADVIREEMRAVLRL